MARFCEECGERLVGGSRFCEGCGARVLSGKAGAGGKVAGGASGRASGGGKGGGKGVVGVEEAEVDGDVADDGDVAEDVISGGDGDGGFGDDGEVDLDGEGASGASGRAGGASGGRKANRVLWGVVGVLTVVVTLMVGFGVWKFVLSDENGDVAGGASGGNGAVVGDEDLGGDGGNDDDENGEGWGVGEPQGVGGNWDVVCESEPEIWAALEDSALFARLAAPREAVGLARSVLSIEQMTEWEPSGRMRREAAGHVEIFANMADAVAAYEIARREIVDILPTCDGRLMECVVEFDRENLVVSSHRVWNYWLMSYEEIAAFWTGSGDLVEAVREYLWMMGREEMVRTQEEAERVCRW